MEYYSKYNVNFHYRSRLKKFTKIWPLPLFFLKIFNNCENNFPSTKQLWTAASSFPQKSWWYLMKDIFVRQNIRTPWNYPPFLSDGSARNFHSPEGIESQDKSAHVFLWSTRFSISHCQETLILGSKLLILGAFLGRRMYFFMLKSCLSSS